MVGNVERLWFTYNASLKTQWEQLLTASDLQVGEPVDATYGIRDDEQLIATASRKGNVIKYVAVNPDYRDDNLLAKLMLGIQEEMMYQNVTHYFLYTKPDTAKYFKSLGFSQIEASDDVVFMEFGKPDFQEYLTFLEGYAQLGNNGAIVMNANPFTKGHRYLVEKALEASEHLYIFVVSEDASAFDTETRLRLVQAGTADLPQVTVLPTRDYMVSQATFPAYFLKDKADLTQARAQAQIDANLFVHQIAPTLNITQRFVGTEPLSPVTDVYNQALQAAMGDAIRLQIIPRLTMGDAPISASRVRELMTKGELEAIQEIVPQTTYNEIIKRN
jgi:[citrate (pro-3S)-lyase] ligase